MTGPVVPTPITADRTEGWLRRFFAAKGRSVVGIQESIQLGLDTVQGKYADQLAPAGVQPFFAKANLAALAGNVGTYALWNPPSSTLVCVVERAIYEVVTGGAMQLSWQYSRVATSPGGGVTAADVFSSDLRSQDDTSGVTTRTGLTLLSQNTAAGFASWGTFTFGAVMYQTAQSAAVAGTRYREEYPAPVVVAPGSAFGAFVAGGAANSVTAFGIFGYVRAGLPGELQKNFSY